MLTWTSDPNAQQKRTRLFYEIRPHSSPRCVDPPSLCLEKGEIEREKERKGARRATSPAAPYPAGALQYSPENTLI
jgi:hypothetical protein